MDSAQINLPQALVDVAVAELPAIIDFLKDAFAKKHPDAPVPTSEEVIAAYQAAFVADIADDEAYRAAHPDPPV